MGAMLRVATLNLYHFAEPGVWWYAAAGDNRFDAAEWAAKRAWLSAELAAMDADVVGFQEVVAVGALADLTRAAGYAHFALVAEPRIAVEGGRRIYRRPVQALASRLPLEAEAVAPRPGFAAALGLAEGWSFRRPPVKARLRFGGRDCVIYCAHLKSPGVSADDAPMDGEAALEPARRQAEGLSRAHAFAAMQRVMEASALYHDVSATLAAAPETLAIVMGDLNDGPDSPSLKALTPSAPAERDGGAVPAPDGAEAGAAPLLIDAHRLAPRALSADARPSTHRAGAEGSAIDFILVSAAAHQPRGRSSAERRGWRLTEHRVFDAHFHRADPRVTSDHAAVLAALAPL